MNDATLVPELIRRESRTFLQYVRESYPWAHGVGDTAHRGRVMAMADEESAEIGKIGRALQRRHIPLPFLGAFPSGFTTSNFLAVSFVIPKLAATLRHDIAELEPLVRTIADAELRAQFEAYVETKRRHLRELEADAAPPQAA
ncbi:MAG: hypothetical protein ACJ8F7_15525 [Gemmataceae bacterium]